MDLLDAADIEKILLEGKKRFWVLDASYAWNQLTEILNRVSKLGHPCRSPQSRLARSPGALRENTDDSGCEMLSQNNKRVYVTRPRLRQWYYSVVQGCEVGRLKMV